MSRPPGSVLAPLGIRRGDRLDLSRHVGLPDDHLPASCWCRSGYVVVTVEDLRAGRTYSCGRARCRDLSQPGAMVEGPGLSQPRARIT